MRWMRGLPALAVMAAAAACEPSADTAVDPAWSKQPCAHCGMLVGDPRYTAEVTNADGSRAFFDDVGCMIAYVHEHAAPPRHAWVHEPEGKGWVDARDARYAGGAATPMGFGLVATHAAEGITFDDAQARVLAKLAAEVPHDSR